MGFTSNCAYQTNIKTNEETQTKAKGAAEQRATRIRRGLPTIKHGKKRRSELRVYDEEKSDITLTAVRAQAKEIERR
jgi:ribosomal protein L13